MDSIGEAAFDYQFGALSQADNEFMKAYFGLMYANTIYSTFSAILELINRSDTLGSPPKSSIFMQTILPVWVLQLMSKYSRRRSLVHARHTAKLANEVARALVKSKAGALLQGRNNRDILSLLVKANASENEATKLTDEEMLAQMRTILLAGHETSATSLCWVLLELARHPEFQDRLRAEIRATEIASGRKCSSFTASDLDGMQYLAAILKESMRFHPALYQNYRQAAKDDVLPLSTPIKTASGECQANLPIPKGMKVILSIAAYHRNKDVFGEDANIFNPERWLRKTDDKKGGPTLGVYGNLLTFAGGIRACIGWRFALYEVQSLTVEIINNFQLLPTPQLERLRREACLVMIPTLGGEELKGENLPLRPMYSRALLYNRSEISRVHSSREKSTFSDTSPLANGVSQRTLRQPRQAMTARESNAFNEMFTMIFDAAAAQEKSLSTNDSAIGVGTDGIDDLIGKLRKYPRRLKWSTELDDILDRQKEVINLFTTDQELLEWATDAVFGESQRYEAAARKAISEAASSGVKGELPMLQPPTYPHLVALIMQAFREKFNDPHLALSMFEYARNLSIASYVFGCSSQAYHQLIETRWKCFQDLTGVLEALQEMNLNGVRVSGHTRRLVEKLRREIGEKHLWTEELEVGSSEVLNIVAQIEKLALSGREAAPPSNGHASALQQDTRWDGWKTFDTKDDGGDEWGFDQWSSRARRGVARERFSDEAKKPTRGSLRFRRSGFEGGFEDESYVGASSSRPKDISWGDEWDLNGDKLFNEDAKEAEFDGEKTFDTEKTASKRSNFMDDCGLEDAEFSLGTSSFQTNTYGNKDEWKSSQGELRKKGVEEHGGEGWGRGPGRKVQSRSFGLKDDWSFEDSELSLGWSNPNVQGSQDRDAWGLDQDPLNEPKRGRITKRRRFGLRADALQQPPK
ncbi:hypothetical protein C0995_013242 [Termitomyces sp. Mi166|nr:hypothetical protein C0995_013242 [Termitomyces sp. Mi166\